MSIFTSPSIRVERDSDGSAVLILDVPGKSVNVFTRQVFADLEAALQRLKMRNPCPFSSSAAASRPVSSPAPI